MTEHVEEIGTFPTETGLDPRKHFVVGAFGRKGSGKTNFQRLLYQSYPFDKLCIDVNGDAGPGRDAETLRDEDIAPSMPRRRDDGQPRNLHYVVDPGSPTYWDNLDRAVGMAMTPKDRPTLVWCDEFGEFTTGNKTAAHMRRLLMQNRHFSTSLLFGGPRPMDINPLALAQADMVAIFDLPNPNDRQRIADTIGYPPRRLTDEMDETLRRGQHWYLLWDSRSKQMYRCPPAPLARG